MSIRTSRHSAARSACAGATSSPSRRGSPLPGSPTARTSAHYATSCRAAGSTQTWRRRRARSGARTASGETRSPVPSGCCRRTRGGGRIGGAGRAERTRGASGAWRGGKGGRSSLRGSGETRGLMPSRRSWRGLRAGRWSGTRLNSEEPGLGVRFTELWCVGLNGQPSRSGKGRDQERRTRRVPTYRTLSTSKTVKRLNDVEEQDEQETRQNQDSRFKKEPAESKHSRSA